MWGDSCRKRASVGRDTRLWASVLMLGVLGLAVLTSVAARAEASSSTLVADDVPHFMDQMKCNACHDVSEARIGPPFKVVALLYANASSETIDVLAQKIIHGGAGKWGIVPMVSNPQISPDQARVVAKWILGLANQRDAQSPAVSDGPK